MRKEKGETQETLAALLEVRRSTYGEYERGKIRPPSSKLFTLAEHFGVTVDYLVGFTEDRSRGTSYGFDVDENMTVFIDWLRRSSTVATFQGVNVDQEQREVLAAALEGARHVMREYMGKGEIMGESERKETR